MLVIKYLLEHGHPLSYALNLDYYEKNMIIGFLAAEGV